MVFYKDYNSYIFGDHINKFYRYRDPKRGFVYSSNYDPTFYDWYMDPLIFDFDFYINDYVVNRKFDLNYSLKHINIDNPNDIKTIKDNSYFNAFSNDRFRKKLELDELPNNFNYGIYYVEIDITNKETKERFKHYTELMFIFTKNDFDNFNLEKWVQAINQISEFKM